MKIASRWLVALAVIAFAGPSRADAEDDRRERASRSFSEAKAAFSLHKYTAAATAFEEAARLVPHPTTWLDAAAAWEAAGDPARAAEDCDRAIALGGADGVTTDAAQRLERLLPKIATLALKGRGNLLVRVDGSDPAPLPAVRRVAAGHHQLVVTDTATNERSTVDIDATAGSVRTVELGAQSPAPPPARETTPPVTMPVAASSGPPLGSWIAFGIGATAALGAGAFGVLTLSAKSTYEETPTQATLDDFKTDRLITNVVAATAVVAVAAGLVIWAVTPRAARTASPSLSRIAF